LKKIPLAGYLDYGPTSPVNLTVARVVSAENRQKLHFLNNPRKAFPASTSITRAM
jgi:hypothetical protein